MRTVQNYLKAMADGAARAINRVTRQDVAAMLNDEDYTANGNFCSVREYFRLVSDGKLRATDPGAPYAAKWKAPHSLVGSSHKISAKAYDAAGLAATDTVSVVVTKR